MEVVTQGHPANKTTLKKFRNALLNSERLSMCLKRVLLHIDFSLTFSALLDVRSQT
jgi:hypothetical protein